MKTILTAPLYYVVHFGNTKFRKLADYEPRFSKGERRTWMMTSGSDKLLSVQWRIYTKWRPWKNLNVFSITYFDILYNKNK